MLEVHLVGSGKDFLNHRSTNSVESFSKTMGKATNYQEKSCLINLGANKPNMSLKQIAEQFSISISSLNRWAEEFGWVKSKMT